MRITDGLESTVSRDPSIMRLAHPFRVPAAAPMFFDIIKKGFFQDGTWEALTAEFAKPGALSSNIAYRLARQPQHALLREFVFGTAAMPGGSGVGHSLASLLALRHDAQPQPLFVFEDGLSELLLHTDLSDEVPVGMLSLPYPRCYLEFGKSRALDAHLVNQETGLHVFEGAYCEYGQGGGCDYLFLMLTGSPLGKANALDDATYALVLPLADPNRSLADAIRVSAQRADEDAREAGLNTGAQEFVASSGYECLLLVAKALLYLALPEARRVMRPERTEALKASAAKKSPAKRAKAERQAQGLSDYVLVTAPPIERVVETGGGEGGRTVKSHWRRGHYRMQAHGEGRALRKLILVKPVLVNASQFGAGAPPAYRVR